MFRPSVPPPPLTVSVLTPSKGMPPQYALTVNLCTACGVDFGSVAAFDKHRVGRHAYTLTEGLAMEPPREDGRRCLDLDELRDAGFVRNALGRWTLAESLERARTRTPVARS